MLRCSLMQRIHSDSGIYPQAEAKKANANVSKYTKTNILRLARYREDSKILTLGARYVSDVGPQVAGSCVSIS